MKAKNTYYSFVSSIKYQVFVLIILCSVSCTAQNISIGANNTEDYVSILENKKIGIVANQTSVIFKNKEQTKYTHLVDSLLGRGISIKKVFSPEHGFRGKADAAEHVANGIDTKTGLAIISLYGKNKKPKKEQLDGLDLVVFDIQDVGVRFYTYISTLHYVMEACAENNIPVMVLDRPNPNSHYIDGPLLNLEHKSFVGMHAVPLVYGMTIGEYAKMINGEQWLKNKIICDLTIIPLKNYTHQSQYHLPIRPSPNLPNDVAINLYPSLGFFEGTPINAGRGTEFQFQRFGSSKFSKTKFPYFPKANFGSKYPKDQNKKCYGFDLSKEKRIKKVNISWLKKAYDLYPDKKAFFGKTFTIHAGNTLLQKQLEENFSAKEIEASWKPAIKKFKVIRKKYLLYK
ncbi:exo-beta-N-acetylmuramidase NamZ domain-containing protein [Bacteroidota bacterium]